jgi:hypothetical protein
MIRSSRFELKKANIPASFLIVDGHQVLYESVNFNSPEQFTVGIANYDDAYLAQQFINYFKFLSKDAEPVKLLQNINNEH